MIPFLAPLALKMAPVKAALSRIPRAAWIALAVIAILTLGTCAHKRSVKKFGEERFAAGVAHEQARLEAKAKAIKAKADAASAKITDKLKAKHDEKVIVINRAADDLRVSGPGKASCPGNPGMAGSSGRSEPASGQGSSARPAMPEQDWAAVPWGWLVESAEKCDLNRAEVLTWREWYRQQSEAWAKIK